MRSVNVIVRLDLSEDPEDHIISAQN